MGFKPNVTKLLDASHRNMRIVFSMIVHTDLMFQCRVSRKVHLLGCHSSEMQDVCLTTPRLTRLTIVSTFRMKMSTTDKDNIEKGTALGKVFLRVAHPLERLLASSRCRDLGLLLRDFMRGRGFTRPCSSISTCCFLCRYSCLMISRLAFSSSLRIRSSSALRLEVR